METSNRFDVSILNDLQLSHSLTKRSIFCEEYNANGFLTGCKDHAVGFDAAENCGAEIGNKNDHFCQ